MNGFDGSMRQEWNLATSHAPAHSETSTSPTPAMCFRVSRLRSQELVLRFKVSLSFKLRKGYTVPH